MHLNYIFRVKAPASSRSLLSSYIDDFPDHQEEFDVTIKHFFTDKYTNIMKDQSDVYRYMNPNKNIPHFQQLLDEKHLYFMQFRVVKIKVAEKGNKYNYEIDFSSAHLFYQYISTFIVYFITQKRI